MNKPHGLSHGGAGMKNGDNTISIVAIISVSYLDYLALRHPCSMVLVVLWARRLPSSMFASFAGLPALRGERPRC